MIRLQFFPQASKIVEWPAGPPGQLDSAFLSSLADKVFLAETSPLVTKTPPAIAVGKTIRKQLTNVPSQLTNLYFCLLKNSKVLGRTVAVINKDKVIFGDISIDWRHPRINHKYRGWKFVHTPLYLRGRTLCLAATGAETFFHLLFDSLGRVWVAEKAGFNLRDFDNLIVQQDTPPLRRLLKLFTGEVPQLVDLSKVRHVQCEDLFVGSYQSAPGHYHPDFLFWLRSKFPHRANFRIEDSRKTIFLSRALAKSRRLLNEDAIIQCFPPRSILKVCLEKHSLDEQLDFFLHAHSVIAPHGAGLSHLTWLQRNLPVLELFPSGFFNACYWELASGVGLQYGCIEGDCAKSEMATSQNFTVSPNLVRDYFFQLLAGKSG